MIENKLDAIREQLQEHAEMVTEHQEAVSEGEMKVHRAEERVSEILTNIYSTEDRLKQLWVDLSEADADLGLARESLHQTQSTLASLRTCEDHAVFALMAELVTEVRPDLLPSAPIGEQPAALTAPVSSFPAGLGRVEDMAVSLAEGAEPDADGAGGVETSVTDEGDAAADLVISASTDLNVEEGEGPRNSGFPDGQVITTISDNPTLATHDSFSPGVSSSVETEGVISVTDGSDTAALLHPMRSDTEKGNGGREMMVDPSEMPATGQVTTTTQDELDHSPDQEVSTSSVTDSERDSGKGLRRIITYLFGRRKERSDELPSKDPVFYIR